MDKRAKKRGEVFVIMIKRARTQGAAADPRRAAGQGPPSRLYNW